jgi:hypothetical protein
LVLAGLNDQRQQGYVRRLRVAALLPRLSVRVGKRTYWGEDLDLRPDRPVYVDESTSQLLQWEVKAGWNLASLVFDGRELRLEDLARRRRSEQRRMAALVAALYVALLPPQPDGTDRKPSLPAQLQNRSRLHQLTGLAFCPARLVVPDPAPHPRSRQRKPRTGTSAVSQPSAAQRRPE